MANAGDDNQLHEVHPSIMALAGKGAAAKQQFHEASNKNIEYHSEQPSVHDLQSGRLRAFSKKGEMDFRVIVPDIELYYDKEMSQPVEDMHMEQESIVPGLYINQYTVFIGDPYSVYTVSNCVEASFFPPPKKKEKKKSHARTLATF